MAPSSSPHDDVPKFGRTRHGSRRIARSTSVAPRGGPAGTGHCSARKAARGLRVCMRKIREPLSCAQRAASQPTANWGPISVLNQNDSTISVLTRHQLAAQCRGRPTATNSQRCALAARGTSTWPVVGATSNPLMRRSTVALRLRQPRIANAAVARQRPANFWACAR